MSGYIISMVSDAAAGHVIRLHTGNTAHIIT